MEFFRMLAEVAWLLRHKKRISYAALRQAYDLNDASLEALRIELIQVEQVAIDENGLFLAWSGDDSPVAADSNTDTHPIPSLAPLQNAPYPTELRAVAENTVTDAVPEASNAIETLPTGAERRQLTVMFCDLVGSTELSTRLDPEDLQDIIRGYQAAATRVIQDFDGFIAKYMGDGILVYFGYPHATERNAEAAVKSALEIVHAMPALNEEYGRNKAIEIAVRIGIATGEVVVGELAGEGEARERTVVGETPNLAARLQGLADTNGIVIGEVTRDLAGDLFIYQELGQHDLKGITDPVTAWSVIGERDDDEQLDFESTVPKPPLVGRQEELGLLTRSWEGSREGLGHVVLIQGEGGIGKTRLLMALRDHVGNSEHAIIRIQPSPYHTASLLYSIIEYFKDAMDWRPGDNAQVRFEKLEGFLKSMHSWPVEESVPLFAALLSLPLVDGRYAQLNMTPTQQREATLDAVVAGFLEMAERQPVLMLWEDLHWADPTTVELLGLLIDQVPTVPMLLIATYRPEFSPPWPMRSHITPITLNRLERTEVEGIVTNIGGKTMPLEVLDHIVAKADGVPLYVEELTRTILQSEILRAEGDRFELTGILADMHIPETLQDSLMARLDRIPMVREVAQIAAVLGREFAYDMIAALAPIEAAELQNGLRQLVENELLYQRGRGERAHYVFKHALIHDAAYNSLLKRARQKYHQQVVELLQERFSETIDAHPEIAAHHYTQAGNTQQAVVYWQKAGQMAARLFAHQEAFAHFSRALELLRSLPQTPERERLELELYLEIGPSIGSIKGFACAEYGESYRQARELCERLGEDKALAPILRGLTFHNLVRGEIHNAVAIATDLLKLTEGQEDEEARMYGHYSLGNCLMCSGEVVTASEHLASAVHSYRPDKHDSLIRVYAIDVGVAAQGNGAICQWLLGQPDEALAMVSAALELAQQHAHPFSLAFAWTWKAIIHQFRSEPDQAADCAFQAMEIAQANRIAMFLGYSTTVYGWALAAQGKHLAGIKKIHEGREKLHRIGVQYFHTYFTGLLADALLAGGRVQMALQLLQHEISQDLQERIWLPELHRLTGKLRLQQGAPAEEVETHFKKALEIARTLQMKSLELRAAVSIAQLWQQRGNKAQAGNLLAPIYGSFAEGLETSDLTLAKAVLDEVA